RARRRDSAAVSRARRPFLRSGWARRARAGSRTSLLAHSTWENEGTAGVVPLDPPQRVRERGPRRYRSRGGAPRREEAHIRALFRGIPRLADMRATTTLRALRRMALAASILVGVAGVAGVADAQPAATPKVDVG